MFVVYKLKVYIAQDGGIPDWICLLLPYFRGTVLIVRTLYPDGWYKQ